jgi:RNase H-fold protein (predicted Holliday junction resolvase)
MSEHTDGKLLLSSSFLVCREDAMVVANCLPMDAVGVDSPLEAAANARRLVAAWNAVDGIPTEDLESKVVVGFMADLKRQKDELERQRDEAVALLQEVSDMAEALCEPSRITNKCRQFLATLDRTEKP